jgi:hypothetical protein
VLESGVAAGITAGNATDADIEAAQNRSGMDVGAD